MYLFFVKSNEGKMFTLKVDKDRFASLGHFLGDYLGLKGIVSLFLFINNHMDKSIK